MDSLHLSLSIPRIYFCSQKQKMYGGHEMIRTVDNNEAVHMHVARMRLRQKTPRHSLTS